MNEFILETTEDIQYFLSYAKENGYKAPKTKKFVNGNLYFQCIDTEQFIIPVAQYKTVEKPVKSQFNDWLNGAEYNPLIFGTDSTENIVSCEVLDNSVEIFIEKDGNTTSKVMPFKPWILSPKKFSNTFQELEGGLYFRYLKEFDSMEAYLEAKRVAYKSGCWVCHNEKEMAMIRNGFTYYKGMKVKDVSVLAIDIESTGLTQDKNSFVIIISNTFRKNGVIQRKQFCYDQYESSGAMIKAWCDWVREVDPSIILGHNVLGFDLPYLAFCARQEGVELLIGRNGSAATFNDYESQYRKDGSQSYSYHDVKIYGREVVDTSFLSMKYDVAAKKYENYQLKNIIKQEGLEVQGRTFYDASQIRFNYKNQEELAKIKAYCDQDGDDALALFDLMSPSFFYLTNSIPKPFQSIINGATGSWLNSFLVRGYFKDGHSIPKATQESEYEGAISFGNPGIYKNVLKVDVASLYPSIMLQYNVYDPKKDPKGVFQTMVAYFTKERLLNKAKAKETGDTYYKDLEQSQKIVINSAYGMLNAPGLNFNSPEKAAYITKVGREILQKSIDWAKSKGFQIANADTDSISFSDSGKLYSTEEFVALLNELNALYPDRIKFENDGNFTKVIVLRAKNYVLQQEGKIKFKGSALKSSTKPQILRDFMKSFVYLLLDEKMGELLPLYNKIAIQAVKPEDIRPWSSKKTVTSKVLEAKATTQQKILSALEGTEFSEGDKVHVYFDNDKNLKLANNWVPGDHDAKHLLKNLYNTLETFETVIDISQFPNYSLKRNKALLEVILNG